MSEFATSKNLYDGSDLYGTPDSEIPGLLLGGGERFICGMDIAKSGVFARDEKNGTANETWPKWPL